MERNEPFLPVRIDDLIESETQVPLLRHQWALRSVTRL